MANDLHNKAALGGNVIYGATSSCENFWSSFAPLDSKLVGQIYHVSLSDRPSQADAC